MSPTLLLLSRVSEPVPDPEPDPIPEPAPAPVPDPDAYAFLTRGGVQHRETSYAAFLTTRRDAAQSVLDTILDTAHTEQRDLTTDEASTVEARRADVLRLAPQIVAATERDQRRAAEVAAMRAAAARAPGAGILGAGAGVTITRPEPVYGPGSGQSYFRDLFHAGRDVDAAARLARHRAGLVDLVTEAERQGRAITTSNLGGAISADYFPDLYVDDLDHGSPMAAFFDSTTITSAHAITVPTFSGVTGDTGAQAAENDPLPSIDVTTAPVTGIPDWIGGEAVVSRQAVDGASPGTDRIVAGQLRQLLMRDRERAVAAMINGLTPVGTIVADAAADEGAEGLILHRGLRRAIARFGTTRHMAAEGSFVSSDTWEILNAAEDTSGRPVMPVGDYVNSSGVAEPGLLAGRVAGVQTMSGWGLPAKSLFVARREDGHVWQSAILDITLSEREGPQSVVYAVAQYFLCLILQPAGVKRWIWTGAAPADEALAAGDDDGGSRSARSRSK